MATEGSKAAEQEARTNEGVANGEYHKDEVTSSAHHHRHIATESQEANPEFMKLANPGPLGLIGFALTTFVLGLYQCGAGEGLSLKTKIDSCMPGRSSR